MTRARAFALLAATLAACSGGGGGSESPPPPPPARPTQVHGLVLGASSASAPGGHRVVAGVLGGAAESKSMQLQVKGGIQP